MKSLHEIQAHAQSLIAADAYLAGETVLVELGNSDVERESALNNRGLCVSVLPLDEGRRTSLGKALGAISVAVFVLTEFSTRVNEDNANKDPYLVLKAIQGALLGYNPVNPNDRYGVTESAFDYSDHDPGLLSYLQKFSKLAAY